MSFGSWSTARTCGEPDWHLQLKHRETKSLKHRSRRKRCDVGISGHGTRLPRCEERSDCDRPTESCGTASCQQRSCKSRKLYLFTTTNRNILTNVFLVVGSLLLLAQQCKCLQINVRIRPASIVAEDSDSQPSQNRVLFKRTAGNNGSSAATSGTSAKLQLEVDALAYLQRYGYMNGTLANANLISEDSFHEAVTSFQRFAGIPETGSVDSLTVRYMQMPRCGNKDRSGKGENGKRRKRRKRYALQGSKWRRQELTYRISQYPTRFLSKKDQVDGQIEKAFKIWSQVAPIDFVPKKEGRVHIDIRFASGEHGDGDAFDGPGNTLAHAYFPQYGGDAHFDDQEYWTVDSYAGTNIFQVAAHELGHSLGLGHSSVREALMAPFYQKYKPNFKLHADDILGIQALYGEKPTDEQPVSSTSQPPPSSTTDSSSETPDWRRRRPTPSPDEDGFFAGGAKPVDLCRDSAVDAITRTEDGNTYVFRGLHYWQIKNEGLAGSPGKISRDWDGLPGNLDAALTWSDGKTFFFKGDKYWRFFNKRREPGYPKLISAGFAGIPNNVDAAFVWSGNGKTYFFKKDKYWRFDSKQEPPVSSQYPKSIKNWGGLPASGIDAAFKWDNGMTYFFKNDLYWRFDDREFEVDSTAQPAFPRSTSEWWFGCTNSNLPIRDRPSAAGEEPADEPVLAASDSTQALVFSRKPNSLFDSINNSTSSSRLRPSGSSISRSFLTGLSALFSSIAGATDSESSASEHDKLASDWSFHRGLGEELRRLEVHKPSRISPQSPPAQHGAADNSRWRFPLGSLQFGGREQSLSELRMEPTTTTTTAPPTTDDSKPVE